MLVNECDKAWLFLLQGSCLKRSVKLNKLTGSNPGLLNRIDTEIQNKIGRMLFIIKTNFLVDKTSIRPRNAFLTYFPAWQFDTQTLPQHHLFYHPTHRGEGTMIVAFWIHLGCR